MNRRQLKKALKFAVLQSTPDVLPKILPDYQPTETLGTIDRKAALGRTRWKVAACVMAAACVFCFSLFHLAQPKVDSLISIDVNPSIELQADKRDRVIESTALNSDAVKILDGLSLKNTDLNTATDAIIGSMVKNGYLPAGSSDNAILISVANNNATRAEQLQQKISTSVKSVLKETNTGAKVLRQTDTISPELQTFARQNNVSVGKADFVRKLTEKDSTLNAQELCKMSVKELSALIDEKDLEISGVVVENDGKLSGVSATTPATDAVISEPASSAPSDGDEDPSGGENSETGSGEGSDSKSGDPQVLPADKPSDEESGPSSSDGEESENEDEDKPLEPLYCRRCGNWLSVCNRTCDPSKPEIYCEYCGRLLSVCNDTCDGEIDFSERYCERCGRYKSVCKGTCDKTAPELYCTDCGRLKSVCLGSCEFYPTYEQVEYTYCERCGEPDFICQDRCDPTAIRAYCKECGGLKTDHKPGCSQYRPGASSSSEPESSSSSEEAPDLYFCERCGRPESVCKDRCDKTKPDIYCRYCGELKTDHAEDCPLYPGESESSKPPPSSQPDSSAPSSSAPSSSSAPVSSDVPSSSQKSSSGTSPVSNKKIIR